MDAMLLRWLKTLPQSRAELAEAVYGARKEEAYSDSCEARQRRKARRRCFAVLSIKEPLALCIGEQQRGYRRQRDRACWRGNRTRRVGGAGESRYRCGRCRTHRASTARNGSCRHHALGSHVAGLIHRRIISSSSGLRAISTAARRVRRGLRRVSARLLLIVSLSPPRSVPHEPVYRTRGERRRVRPGQGRLSR